MLYLNIVEYIFFLDVYEMFFKIDYMLGYKVSLNKLGKLI